MFTTIRRYTLKSPSHRALGVHLKMVVGVAAAVMALSAASAGASTLAYVNASDGNVYVADSSGSGAQEVATGVSSPSLAANGTLYALAGSQVDVFAPGSGAQTPIPITGSNPTQLAVSPTGGMLAWTDGQIGSATTLTILNRATGTTRTIANGAGPHWFGLLRAAVSVFDISSTAESSTHADIAGPFATHPVWFPDMGFPAAGFAGVLEYAPNRTHTLAAAVVLEASPRAVIESLVVFPITSTLGPSGNPLTTSGAACAIGASDFGVSPQGDSFAWSPDGSALAYTTSSGIAEVTVGPWNSDCSQIGSEQLVVPGAYAVSWGPSNRRNFPAPGAGS